MQLQFRVVLFGEVRRVRRDGRGVLLYLNFSIPEGMKKLQKMDIVKQTTP